MFETCISEWRGHLRIMGETPGFLVVCLSAFFGSFAVPLWLCAQADIPSEIQIPFLPSSPYDMPCFINSYLQFII